MKTSKIVFSMLLLSVVLIPTLAMAAVPTQPNSTVVDLNSMYDKIGVLLWQVVAIIALILFVIAGIQFMTAAGDPTKIATARQFVLWGVVGIVVAILAYSIVTIAGSFL